MKSRVCATFLVLATMVSRPGWAAGSEEDWKRCIGNTPEVSIEGCSAVITAGDDKPETLAAAYANRAAAYQAQGRFDLAIKDYDQAVTLKPKDADIHDSRGLCYRALGQYDRAIKDYDQAVALNPKLGPAFYDRGRAYQIKGQYERAVMDYDLALNLNPFYADAINARGRTNFSAGRFSAAAEDFGRSLSVGIDPYVVIWLHLARARGKEDDSKELAANAAKIDPDAWPGPVIAYFLKKTAPEQLKAAADNGDDKTRAAQDCELAYFLGEDALIRQNQTEGVRLLQQAAGTCPQDFEEYEAAEAELRRQGRN